MIDFDKPIGRCDNSCEWCHSQEFFLQNDAQKKGWGPFKTEDDAWKYLFGRVPTETEIDAHERSGWYVGFVNKWTKKCDIR